jgi:hypothetical protein
MDLTTFLQTQGYRAIKMLNTGELAALHDEIYTTGLCIGLDEFGYRTRYCYETHHEAEEALAIWDGNGDPPGLWLKQKPEERLGPGLGAPVKE